MVANGLPLRGGAQLAVDATRVSPVRRNGASQPGASDEDGIQLHTARRRKERTYQQSLRSGRCRLVVVAVEVGGRWSEEALRFVRLLAKAKSCAVPQVLRMSTRMAFQHRWTGILAVAAQRTFAATLLDITVDNAAAVDGDEPFLEEVMLDARLVEAPVPSRLPVP